MYNISRNLGKIYGSKIKNLLTPIIGCYLIGVMFAVNCYVLYLVSGIYRYWITGLILFEICFALGTVWLVIILPDIYNKYKERKK